MLTLPFRLAATIALALFCYSRFVRRAVAGVAVSSLIVASQHADLAQLMAPPEAGDVTLAATLKALMLLVAG